MSNQPPPYSPLAALARKSVFWVFLPAGVVLASLYGIATYKTPYERFVQSWISDTIAKVDKAMEALDVKTELQRRQAANHPDAKRLEAELSGLTPEQRMKRVNELMDDYARKVRAGQQ